jgi:hypothetical protein
MARSLTGELFVGIVFSTTIVAIARNCTILRKNCARKSVRVSIFPHAKRIVLVAVKSKCVESASVTTEATRLSTSIIRLRWPGCPHAGAHRCMMVSDVDLVLQSLNSCRGHANSGEDG